MRIPALGSITITRTTRSNVDLASVIREHTGSRLTVSVCSLMTDARSTFDLVVLVIVILPKAVAT
jgi:hypothetical protein